MSSRSQAARIISSSRKRTSSLLGCTFTSTAPAGITRFSTHMGYMPMVTRLRQTCSSTLVSMGQRTERPLMKNSWWARVALANSPTPIRPWMRVPPSFASTSTIFSAASRPYTANTAWRSLPSPKL